MSQCAAHSKRTGQRCRDNAMRGSHLCYHHGGATPKGIAAPQMTTGKYSRFLSLRLASHYHDALADPDIHSIKDEVGLAEARLKDLLSRTESSDLGHAWLTLDAAWQEFARCRTLGDVAGMGVALAQVEAQVARGKADYLLWSDITDKLKLLSDLRLKEHKRLIDLQAMITEERALLIFGLIMQAIREAVLKYAEKDTASHILRDIQEAVREHDLRVVPQR